jgi:phosphoribosyl 1,2-cyclic phosphodiesterase
MTDSGDGAGGLSVCVLASGSKGNAIYISDGTCSILLDAGLSGKAIELRMREKDLDPAALTAVLVSHEHSDHIQGVGVLSRRYNLPVYIAKNTLKAAPQLGRLHEANYFECGQGFSIGSLSIHPFSISHDAADPAGFTFQQNGAKIGIATDLGIATTMVKEHLKDCILIVLEANHDSDMLINGPYPWPLKQRIKGRSGHLSNHDSSALLKEIQHDQLKYVVLAHLSETNNTPDMAYQTVGEALTRCRAHLSVALQDRCGELIHLGF